MSFRRPFTSTKSSSSKICAICLASMKAGKAVFKSECAHSFHFECIVSNVNHGNRTCPICRANWKQVPQQAALQRVLMKTYTEVPAVPRSSIVDDFTVLINLKALVLASTRAPLDLVTVLDISNSMAGTKLAFVKRAMSFVIQNLEPGDRLSVVVFSNTARCLFPLKKMSDSGKRHALQAVNLLVANGGTSIAEGLIEAKEVMSARRKKNPMASIILLTDGQSTSRMSGGYNSGSGGGQNRSTQRLLALDGIDVPVHAFGIGTNKVALLMHRISNLSGGTLSFIEAESEKQDAFAQRIGGFMNVVVRGLQVMVESVNPSIGIQSLKPGRYTSHLTDERNSGLIEVGDLYADEEREFLVSVNIPEETDLNFCNETLLLKVHCCYTDPMTNETVNLASENVTIQRPESVGNENVVSVEVDRERNRLQSAEAMGQARAAAEEGDLARGQWWPKVLRGLKLTSKFGVFSKKYFNV